MPKTEKLTVAEALAQAQLIDGALTAWEQTAPRFVSSIGGRDALARMCEMTCIGPVARLDVPTWEGAIGEHLERWQLNPPHRYIEPPEPSVLPGGAPEQQPKKRSRWGFFGRG